MLFSSVVLLCRAQDATGIQFEQGSNWNDIQAKAKAGHKYIFVDCYATWCGPCKTMEQAVYPSKSVGDAFNKDFISVKLQMNRTQKDDSNVKAWYGTAQLLESTYRINQYPAFLFFDPEGRPVHKAIGYKGAEDFIQLAEDAKDPHKQYYAILRNFRPGKLDTAEEKSLARSFFFTDKTLGGKLAFDYLRRIPKAQLGFPDNLYLMVIFRDNIQLSQLSRDYVNRLPEQALCNKAMLDFLFNMAKPQDRGFKFIYDHQSETDTVMHDPHWAQDAVSNIIASADFAPLLDSAKKTGITPVFDSIGATIAKKYNSYYASRVIQDAKIKWYSWLVHEKSQTQYWSQLIQVDIERGKRIWEDQARNSQAADDLNNNICYGDIFHHSDDTAQLNLAVRWMKQVLEMQPGDPDDLDTYACLLYKTGKIDDALQIEEEVLQFCMKHRKAGTHARMLHTTIAIQRMWNKEKIWEEKEFQD